MQLSELYRIPWTKHDNPNGWIEVTTACQLDCPGCYRGYWGEEEATADRKLGQLKADVDTLVARRNIQCLSIAGGEPLLFPRLDELITYARSKGISPRLYTNGVQLDEERLDSLVEAGCTEVIIHASLWQNRLANNTQDELVRLKSRYCRMFRGRQHEVRLGFIAPVLRRYLDGLDDLLEFYKSNSDVIGNVVFTTFKDVYGGPSDQYVPLPELNETIERVYGTQPCAYIPKIHHQERVAWLLNIALLRRGKVIGQLSGDAYGMMQEQYRETMGKYLFSPEPGFAEAGSGLLGMGELGEELPDLVRAMQRHVHYQVVSIVDSPQMLDDGRVDVCDSCPDAMLYEGDLVPKCLLNKIRDGLPVCIVR